MQKPPAQSLTPYVNPPIAARARGLIMSDNAGAVQVIAHEGGLMDIASLATGTNRPAPAGFARSSSRHSP